MSLDIRTVMFMTAIGACLMGVGIFATAYSYANYIQGMRHWACACGVEGAGWALLCARGALPDFLSVVAANTLILLSIALYRHALKEFQRSSSNNIGTYVLVFLTFGALNFFMFAVPNSAGRLVIVSIVAAWLLVMCAREILLCGRTRLPFSHWMTGIGFFLCGIASVLRAVLASVFKPPAFDLFSPAPFQNAIYISLYISVVAITFGFLLMCSDKFNTELHRLATLDPLTGSFNRGAIELLMKKEFDRSRRSSNPMSLLMLDVDHFKAVNDTHGHSAGDMVLRGFAEVLRGNLRSEDLVGRYGGEEFIVLLPNTNLEQAFMIADRLRGKVADACLDEGRQSLRCTVSGGIASLHAEESTPAALMQRADAALYEAKHEGRNRIVVAS